MFTHVYCLMIKSKSSEWVRPRARLAEEEVMTEIQRLHLFWGIECSSFKVTIKCAHKYVTMTVQSVTKRYV